MERRGVIFHLLYGVMLLLLLLMIPMIVLKKTLLLMPFWQGDEWMRIMMMLFLHEFCVIEEQIQRIRFVWGVPL